MVKKVWSDFMIKFNSGTFHLQNDKISYIIKILKNNHLGHLYFGKKVFDRDNFDHLLLERECSFSPYPFKENPNFSLESIKQEYPCYGTGDYRNPAFQLELSDGSRITNFVYKSHEIFDGKNPLKGLPHIHGDDIESLEITLHDEKINCDLILNYSIFKNEPGIVRSAKFINHSDESVKILSAMSSSIDFYDSDYQMMSLDGSWARERHVHTRKLTSGVQSVSSARGASSAQHNPFIALKRESTTENAGEAIGFSLIYSGNFLASCEVDAFDVTRVIIGINPFEFSWTLDGSMSFQTPESVLVYSENGLNGMSQAYHNIFINNLMKSKYKNKTRPILLNNWEATYFDFSEESILEIARKAKELGIELFVLDDGWFGSRSSDESSLGDWDVNLEKIPSDMSGLSKKINDLGLDFGLWFEPEMINEVSELYKKHSDYVISVPGQNKSYSRHQFVLDFSRDEVVTYIFNKIKVILDKSSISYIKWDMNRNITEAYSLGLSSDRQKEFFHRYILGVYDLYERLTSAYPDILFESCAGGGGRFDPGMLYYAPQTWTSDNTDAVERLHIQYGTSMVYPIVSMGSHVSAVPNHQVLRNTSLDMRANVAYFGTFGYELDVNKMTSDEQIEVKSQIEFFKKHREVIQFGDFYRLKQGNIYSWQVVSKDKETAIFAFYQILFQANPSIKKIRLEGLDPQSIYTCETDGKEYFGDELMNIGYICPLEYGGVADDKNKGDFTSHVYIFHKK